MVGASPARVVRRMSRTSLRSKRRARCIVARLSQMTRSYCFQACEWTNSRCVACSVRSRRKERASGTVHPSIAPACADRNSDLRPVSGWMRTRRWRTGRKLAISSGVRSVKPIAPARMDQGVLADQILDLVLGPLVERVVGRAHVGELGVAAPRRDDAGRQEGMLRRDLRIRAVGVPEPVAQLEEPLAVVARNDLAVLVEVGQIADPGAEAALRCLADVAGPGLDLELAEVAREGDLLRVGDVLAVKDQHRMPVHALVDRGGVLAAERLRQIDAGNLADEHGMDLFDGERHFAVVLQRSNLL